MKKILNHNFKSSVTTCKDRQSGLTKLGLKPSDLQQAGLTLIEVIFAIILFAGAMITILGLQSSNLSRTNEDKNKIRAMLAAREILAAIEIQEEPLPVGSQQGSVEKILSTLISHPEKIDNSPFNGLIVDLEISNVALPLIGENAMQKAAISVNWGDKPFEAFKTTYYLTGEVSLKSPANQEQN